MKRRWIALGAALAALTGAALLARPAAPAPAELPPPAAETAETEARVLARADDEARRVIVTEPLTCYAHMEDREPIPMGPEAVPPALLETLRAAMEAGEAAELETLSALMDDTELPDGAFQALTGTEGDWLGNDTGDVMAVSVDGDDDGMADIAAELYYGGSGGFTDFVFYQGQADGTYRETCRFCAVIQEFGFIRYEGRHYLVRTGYNYSTKQVDGLEVLLYRDGVLSDAQGLSFEAEGYDRTVTYLAPEGEAALAALEHLADVPGRIETCDGPVCGTAETAELQADGDWVYVCDLDGDGTAERYHKRMFLPTNTSTVQGGWLEFQDGGFPALEAAIEDLSGREMRFYTCWTDTVEGRPVTYLGFWRPTGYTVFAVAFQRAVT